MYLNSFLFPAPKCSYSADLLKDELIWVPKYQKKQQAFARLHTTNDENTKNTYGDSSLTETPRNLIPQMKSKKHMPFSAKFQISVSDKGISHHKLMPKTPIINDKQCQNHPKKVPEKLGDFGEGSMPDLSGIYDEKPENKEIFIKEAPPKVLIKKNTLKAKDLQTSYNVSVDNECHGVQGVQPVGPNLCDKKFFLSGSNLSTKISKASTRDSTMSTEVNNIPYVRARAPVLKKRTSKKLSQTFNFGDDMQELDCDIDEGIITTECSTQLNTITSPRNFFKYETKVFQNPHSLSDKFASHRKVVTEYTDTLPDQIESPISDLKSKMYSRLSLAGPMKETVEYHIPCLMLKSRFPNNKVIIYFHGNGEDVNLARELLTYVRDQLDITVIAIEYPGYGLYKGACTEEQIQTDAEAVFDYLVSKVGIHPRNIILFGRSIGSGPATWLASRKNIGALVIMSAFTSIRAVVQHLAGKWAQYLIKERFNNLDHISRVTCPTFIVHGQKDRLIPYKHSQDLHSKCRGLSELVLPRDMDHIEFDFHDDFTAPLAEFLSRIRFGLDLDKGLKMTYPAELFRTPKEVQPVAMSYRTPR